MKKTILLLSVSVFFNFFANAQSEIVDVPAGIVYKTCADSINQKVKKIILKELSDSCTYLICDKMLFCGPKLWQRYKDLSGVGEIAAGNITFKVPFFDEKGKQKSTQNLTGKLVQTHEDFIVFWKQVIKDFDGSEITVRKLHNEELSYYWAIIFFDIEEPVFAVECATHTFLFDMSQKGQLEWIEQLK
jgi:hypothetical protein